MKIAIVDTGYGNIRSVERATLAAAAELARPITVERSADADLIRRADAVIFPGQGAFRDCAGGVGSETRQALLEKLKSGSPFLGICVGLQLLFEGSEEAPGCAGLGWFKGQVLRLNGEGVKIPHMGWNQLELEGEGHPHLAAIGGSGTWVYFVHSYHAVPLEVGVLRATVSYGKNAVTAAVARDNVLATQFHPEKSQGAGLKLLKVFLSG